MTVRDLIQELLLKSTNLDSEVYIYTKEKYDYTTAETAEIDDINSDYIIFVKTV